MLGADGMFDVPHVLQLTCDRPLIWQCQGTCIILRTVSKPPDVDEIIIDDIAIEFDNCLLDSKPWPAFAFLHHALLTARLRCTTIRIELVTYFRIRRTDGAQITLHRRADCGAYIFTSQLF